MRKRLELTILIGFAVLMLVTVFLLAGCASVSPFAGLSSPPQPKKMANYSQSEKQTPLKIGVTPDGRDVIAYATERSYTAESAETPERLSFIQRLGRWISGLSFLAVIFIVVSLLFFGGAPIVFLYKKYRDMRGAFVNTIRAIDQMPKEAYEQLKPELKSEQNEADKHLVKELKVDIPD